MIFSPSHFLKLRTRAGDPRGFTILETLIALSVVAVGVVGTLTLSSQTVMSSRASQHQEAALNLAREGIEVVRRLRDGNSMRIEAGELANSEWDKGLFNASDSDDYTARAEFTNGDWTLNYLVPALGACGENCRLYIDESTGIYSHESADTKTIFRRGVETNAICTGHTIVKSGSLCAQGKIGVQVFVTVEWEEQNRTGSLSLEERLYDWRP